MTETQNPVVHLRLAEVLEALPAECLQGEISAHDADTPVALAIPGLMRQLASGRVAVRLRVIAEAVPPSLIRKLGPDDSEREIDLPLHVVVEAVPADVFDPHVPRKQRVPGAEQLPNLFHAHGETDAPAQPAPAATGVEEVSAPVPAPEPRPVEEAAETLDETASDAVAAAPEPPPVLRLPVMVNDTDINSADEAAMAKRLGGIGRVLARRIVAHRPYRSVYDLVSVPGIGKRLFRRITGRNCPLGVMDSTALRQIFPAVPGDTVSLRDVARRVAQMPGVRGCVLSHADGRLLASFWKRGGPAFSGVETITPQIFKQIQKYFDLLKIAGPDAITLFLDPYPVFIKSCGDLFLAVVVSRSRISIRRVELFEALAEELAHRLAAQQTPENRAPENVLASGD